MIKRLRGGSRVGATAGSAKGGDKRKACDDIQRLLVEQWRLAIVKERLAAKQRRLGAPVSPSSLDEITIVTRIGRLRFLRELGGNK